MRKNNKPPRKCTSEAQKRAIRRSYAERAKKETVSVTIKNHRDKNGGHPHVIVDDIEDKHVSVGLSTNPKKGKNSPNYALELNPLNDGKQSYMRRQGTVAPQKEYEKERYGVMTTKDYGKAQEYGERAKQKYIEKKNKKSSEPPNTQ